MQPRRRAERESAQPTWCLVLCWLRSFFSAVGVSEARSPGVCRSPLRDGEKRESVRRHGMSARGPPGSVVRGLLAVAILLIVGKEPVGAANKAAGSGFRTFTPFYFLTEPADVVTLRGAPAVLNCSVHAEPTPKIEWKKDGTFLNLVSDDRRSLLPDGSLFITSVVHSKHNKPDEGIYQCVATVDSLGSIVSRTARLSVAGLPRFASQPEASSVYVGDSLALSCDVSAELVPFVQWEQNRLVRELDNRVAILFNGSLVISNASESDAGLYRCAVGSGAALKYSDEAELKVLSDPGEDRPLVFLRQPSPLTRVVGQTALLTCVVSGYPTPVVYWSHNQEELILENSDRFALLAGGSLQISNVTEEDAGIYTCTADNGNQTIQAHTELSLQVPPVFLVKPSNTHAYESMDIVFTCEVSGKPTPTIKWVKNGDMVIPSDYFKIVGDHNLQVLGLVRSDEGFYQCIAENEVGNVQSAAQLIILEHAATPGGPRPSSPRDVVASLVSTRFIKLTWRVPADAYGENLTYHVYYSREGMNRERVENASHPGEMQVTIQNLLPETVYYFRVVAQNQYGPGESSSPLKVETQPEVQVPGPAPNLRATAVSPTSVDVSWETPLSGNGEIQNYKLYYMERGAGDEQDIDVGGHSYTVSGLKKYTEYTFRIVAYNKHGPGVSTQDILVRTLSDAPSAPPQNLTLEVRSSQSILVQWQPPPPGTQNGQIVGYKVRYRKTTRKSETSEILVETQLSQLVAGLERDTEYSFRVAAMTVNGSGPATEWMSAETFENDLDESRVPDVPSSLHVRPLVTSIVVSWTPPENMHQVVVRGYSIGYGLGSPHAQTVRVDHKQRYYTIENLDPSSHYVISLKAFNNVGEGIPLYESAVTRQHTDPSEVDVVIVHAPYTPVPEPSPMLPPVGVQASILSSDTVRLTWADNSLPKNQKITDARYYTARWKTNIPANTKYKFANSTTLSYLVTGLKPNTLYEFSVMVTKGRRSSTWSMTAHGTTLESVPSSPPKDVTVVSKEGKPRTIIVNWQPPSEANGKITGYIIYYSTDVQAELHDWVIEPVVGNRLTHQIQELTLDTPYYFKIQARNSKGMGPMSEAVLFRTPKESSPYMPNNQASGKGVRTSDSGSNTGSSLGGNNSHHGSPTSLDQNMLLTIIVSLGVITVLVAVVIAAICSRRSSSHNKKKRAACKSANGSHKYKGNSKDVKPPDLWIHHERLELKPVDKSPETNPILTDTPIPRSPQDITPGDSTTEGSIHQHSNSYRGLESEDSVSSLVGRRAMRPKIMMPFDSQPPQPVVSAHPIHSLDNSHHFRSVPGFMLHVLGGPPQAAESVRHAPSCDTVVAASSSSQTGPEEPDPPGGSFLPGSMDEDSVASVPTAHIRPSHPLKSFAVPAVPAPAPSTGYEPVLPSSPLLAQQAPTALSVKTASLGTLGRVRPPLQVTVPNAPEPLETSRMLDGSESSYEPDELSKEMAHLEGLMKDLNAITTA
ncbi:neogenin isoform X4 [Spea bombifrons]|uniref:neogenin isoform X4 n=1 Tax=Spea bombifrons TaxID=233779 RepID=UPI002349FBDC|nr:neogenin isoform X4 [Spea bombifrons]